MRVPVTSSPYNMYFGMRPLAILWTWPSHRKRRWLSSVYILKLVARSSTSVLVILSCQEMSISSLALCRLSRPHCYTVLRLVWPSILLLFIERWRHLADSNEPNFINKNVFLNLLNVIGSLGHHQNVTHC